MFRVDATLGMVLWVPVSHNPVELGPFPVKHSYYFHAGDVPAQLFKTVVGFL